MKLYLLIRNENIGYGEYASCVVCAKNEKDAKTIPPDYDPEEEPCPSGTDCYGKWTDELENITAVELGTSKKGIKRGVICASFNTV